MVLLEDVLLNTNTPEAWIFVSHASADLLAVRKVRNYLENLGASPLIFHLRGLREPEHIWPVIEREIAHRNFFLYCESAAAETSEWVQRERATVEAIRSKRLIRVDRVRVDRPNVDEEALTRFMTKVRVYPLFHPRDELRVGPYISALQENGFQVLSTPEFDDREEEVSFARRAVLDTSADGGFIVPFVSFASVERRGALPSKVMSTLNFANFWEGKIVPVFLDRVHEGHEHLKEHVHRVGGHTDPSEGARRLVEELFSR